MYLGLPSSRLFVLSGILLATAGSSSLRLPAQQAPSIVGNYLGALGTLHLQLHITASNDGVLSCTLDSPDQGAAGLPCVDLQRGGSSLSFSLPVAHASWKGTISGDGRTLAGTWNQVSPLPLTFTRDTFVAVAKPSAVDGVWLGTLHVGPQTLRIQVTVRSDATGREDCTLDSLDQRASGLSCAGVTFNAPHLTFEVPVVKGHWAGELSTDGTKLTGIWNQGNALPLEFTRQTKSETAIQMDPALPPVSLARLQSVLQNDLEHSHAFESGVLAPSTGIGITIGVLDHGSRSVFSFGAAKPDSLFEIGSITKTFTGLILAQMVQQGKVTFDEPVRELLPAGTAAKPASREITLLDLATQRSGLPRLPDNFHPADPQNPYADYRADDLYAYIATHGVARPEHPDFLYSNLGFGLLGQALADRAAMPYPQLLQSEITGPLGMPDTTIALSSAEQTRLLPGHASDRTQTHPWDFDAMAGAGAIRSTAADLLTYLAAQLHPAAVRSAKTSAANTMAAAIAASQKLRGDGLPGHKIALAWWYAGAIDLYSHDGETGGYNAVALFNPRLDRAIIVLVNMSSTSGNSAGEIAQHILERMDGQPAISLLH